jgi:hypothetical protein
MWVTCVSGFSALDAVAFDAADASKLGFGLEHRRMSGIYPFLSKWTRIDGAILCAYSQPVFERVARKHDFGPRAWMFQNIAGILIAIMLLIGGLAIIGAAARQSLLDAYGSSAPGVVKHVSFRTNSYGRKTKWQMLDYEFTTGQGASIKARLERPVQEWSGVVDHDRLVVVYWDRFPAINAPRGVRRGGGALVLLGALFMLCGVHFVCFVRRGIRWRRSLLAASASTGQDQSGQLPHVVKNDGSAGGA